MYEMKKRKCNKVYISKINFICFISLTLLQEEMAKVKGKNDGKSISIVEFDILIQKTKDFRQKNVLLQIARRD